MAEVTTDLIESRAHEDIIITLERWCTLRAQYQYVHVFTGTSEHMDVCELLSMCCISTAAHMQIQAKACTWIH